MFVELINMLVITLTTNGLITDKEQLNMETQAVVRRRTRLSPEARRQQLMDCAIEVFSKRGIGRAGHAEIADLAQVSVATVFNYFNTREELVDNVLAQIEHFFTDMVSASFSHDRPLKDCIHEYISAFVNAAFEQPQYTYIWLEWSSAIREESWDRYIRLLERNIATISQKLQSAIDNNELNTYLTTSEFARSLSNQGYMIIQLVNQPNPLPKAEIIQFVEKYINSALCRTPEPVNC